MLFGASAMRVEVGSMRGRSLCVSIASTAGMGRPSQRARRTPTLYSPAETVLAFARPDPEALLESEVHAQRPADARPRDGHLGPAVHMARRLDSQQGCRLGPCPDERRGRPG